MGFTYLSNKTLDEALGAYQKHLASQGFAPRKEPVLVSESLGRVTSRAVYAKISSPHYHASAMDGIAVQAADTFGATATTPIVLSEDQFVPVDTGDPLPENCDAVVMIEDVFEQEGGVQLFASAAPWQHIRQIGEDICAGEMIVPSYTEVTPALVGALLAGGILELEVFARPRVGIIPTGDEVVPPSANPPKGAVMEFNSGIFSGMVRRMGGIPHCYPIVADIFEDIVAAVEAALQDCDIVLLNAGSSAGRDDLSAEVVAQVGEVFCHGIAIKPGKPTILGNVGDKPLIGVPGYPVSGIIVIEEFLAPLMRYLGGAPDIEEEYIEAQLSRRVVSSLKYLEFVRVRLGVVEESLIASPLDRGAGVINSFVKADGLLEIPQNSEGYEAGTLVKVKPLRSKEELQSTLVVTGSHDPLIDELAELLRQNDRRANLASTHVGSMGAIMAAKRHEMHMGGIHLLDTETGEYNTSYIERYLPDGGFYQVECVQRVQGLMVAPHNPLNIAAVEDLAQEGLRYINRQKGSGTRILCDHLCEKAGIDTSSIYGYDHEEMTHTAVAAQIAAGSADAGMGIYSAALLYDLDFIPLCDEQYDLLVPAYAWDLPLMQSVLEILQGDAFKARLEEMGGYKLDKPGTLRRAF